MSSKITINEAIEWLRALNERHKELCALRNSNSATETRHYGQTDRPVVKDPVYDVVKLDVQVATVAKEIRKLRSALHATNAVAHVEGYEMDEAALGELQDMARSAK